MLEELITKLEKEGVLSFSEFKELISNYKYVDKDFLYEKALSIRRRIYGNDVYLRALIEFTNYCKNDCYYCGIRKSNRCADRYRLTSEQILETAKTGYNLGFRTFVLQGGEDPFWNKERIGEIVSKIKTTFPDCAITLSIGEHSKETYKYWFDMGADRYLLRHETADIDHYQSIHPEDMNFDNRIRCLYDLKDIGYQVGAGFMVGSPNQTPESLAKDMLFLKKLEPHMVGIGPFIPHHDTPYKNEETGDLELTLFMLAITRIMLTEVLLPATTALGTINPMGRELGIKAGANVLMPNLSPVDVRKKYELYDNKICTGEEAAECRNCLDRRIQNIGFQTVVSRGDHISKIGGEYV